MVDRSAAGTRYYPEVVDRIVGPWRDAGPEGPEGRVVIVSGTPQSGRASVLGQVADDLRRAGVRVVRRAVRDGALRTVDDAGPGEHAVQGAKVVAAALQVAGAGVVGNLIALGAEIATAHHMLDGLDPHDLPTDPYLHVHRVAEAVRQRAEQEPLALVVDDAHGLDPPQVWWDALFGTILPRLATHLPVLVVLGVERTSTAAGSHALQRAPRRRHRGRAPRVPARGAGLLHAPRPRPAVTWRAGWLSAWPGRALDLNRSRGSTVPIGCAKSSPVPEEQMMIVTIARVSDPDRFLEVFETVGAEKRREHGCRSARVYFDPDDAHRAWSVFDWDPKDYDGFLADPEVPAIARDLGLQAPPVHAVAATELDA